MSSPSSCSKLSQGPIQLLKVMCSAKETYGFPYGHLIYFQFMEASHVADHDVLHIRFSVKGVRVTGTNLAELVAGLSENTLEFIRPFSTLAPESRQELHKGKKPYIESIQIVEAPGSKKKG